MTETIRRLRDLTGGSTGCGWVCDEVAAFLFALVRFHRPDLVIQTGHLWGKSAVAVLEAFGAAEPIEDRAQDADPRFAAFVEANRPRAVSQRLISIDPHPIDVPHPHLGVAYLNERYGGRFLFAHARSSDFFDTFVPEPHERRIMGIVDGDHSTAGCFADLEALARLNAQLIVVDDVTWLPELADVAERFAGVYGYGMNVHRIYNGLAVLTHA